MTRTTRRLTLVSVAAAASVALLASCSTVSASSAGSSDGTLIMWTHNAGNSAELGVVQQVVKDFNASQSKYKVKIQAFPQTDYNTSVTSAATAHKLPCILDSDGPTVPSWAWGGYLAPLDVSSGQVALSDQLPSTVGKYNGKVYTFGFYDVALTMFSRKSVLTKYGIRIPTLDKPWTKDEFDAALAKLKASGKFQYPLDMQTGGTGEWWPYAFSPMLQSFGGDLINRTDYKSADGALNGSAAIAWGNWFRSLVTNGYMPQKSSASPNNDFLNGKSAIEWDGSWDAATNSQKLGDDLVVLPPPDFGNGPKIGGASWQWGMSSTCSNKAGALAYLNFSRQTKYFVDFAKATGTLPATAAAAAQVPGYGPGQKFQFFFQEANKYAQVRPVTPAYPFISTVFQKTAQDILAGANVKSSLDQAVSQINNNLKTNNNYSG